VAQPLHCVWLHTHFMWPNYGTYKIVMINYLFYVLQWRTNWVIYLHCSIVLQYRKYLMHQFFWHNAIRRQCNYGCLTLHYRTLIPKLFKVNQVQACEWIFLISSTFQTNFVQLIKPSWVFARLTGIQALPSPVNSIIIKYYIQ